MKLYTQYLKEREDMDVVCVEHGFATYKKVSEDTYYLVDVFVEKLYRRNGIASELNELVTQIALQDGAKKLLGSVDITKPNVTGSMAVILANGYKYSHANGNGIYFIKEIGG